MKTAEKIRALRISKGMTQEELGKACGLQRAAINKYEKGTVVNIKRSVLQKLADALGVAPVDLLDDDEAVVVDNFSGTSQFNGSEQRRRLIYYFNNMDKSAADMLLAIAETMADQNKKG